ncbi:hypothetical protein GCM10017559_77270 [Streptosporangium longisporum]|uniref:Uncharacterized protein n=1 Tax=Streptosporangium longisporum TaxID=46187 RepID=A0ABP6LDC5_9ACTN
MALSAVMGANLARNTTAQCTDMRVAVHNRLPYRIEGTDARSTGDDGTFVPCDTGRRSGRGLGARAADSDSWSGGGADRR